MLGIFLVSHLLPIFTIGLLTRDKDWFSSSLLIPGLKLVIVHGLTSWESIEFWFKYQSTAIGKRTVWGSAKIVWPNCHLLSCFLNFISASVTQREDFWKGWSDQFLSWGCTATMKGFSKTNEFFQNGVKKKTMPLTTSGKSRCNWAIPRRTRRMRFTSYSYPAQRKWRRLRSYSLT